jgi:hypothetical protein
MMFEWESPTLQPRLASGAGCVAGGDGRASLVTQGTRLPPLWGHHHRLSTVPGTPRMAGPARPG